MPSPEMLAAVQAASTYEIPIWHPIVVHYPIALVAAGTISALGWLIVGSSFWRYCTTYLYVLGLGAAVTAYWTGEEAYEQSRDVPIVEELGPLHAEYAAYTLVGVVVVTTAIVAATVWMQKRSIRTGPAEGDPFWLRAVVAVLSTVTTILIAYTAHLGGLMVWGTWN